MEPIRIFIVEDQTLMRQGLKTILDLEPGMRVIGETEDGETAIQRGLETRPDVTLMDIQIPRLNGLEATEAICAAWPEAKVIILTTFIGCSAAIRNRSMIKIDAAIQIFPKLKIPFTYFSNIMLLCQASLRRGSESARRHAL